MSDLVWFRFDEDGGLQWPGFLCALVEDTDARLEFLREVSAPGRRRIKRPGPVSIFWLPHVNRLVEGSDATSEWPNFDYTLGDCRAMEREKELKQAVALVDKIKRSSEKHQGMAIDRSSSLDSCASLTPSSTLCEFDLLQTTTTCTTPDACLGWTDPSSQSETTSPSSSLCTELEPSSGTSTLQNLHTSAVSVVFNRSSKPPSPTESFHCFSRFNEDKRECSNTPRTLDTSWQDVTGSLVMNERGIDYKEETSKSHSESQETEGQVCLGEDFIEGEQITQSRSKRPRQENSCKSVIHAVGGNITSEKCWEDATGCSRSPIDRERHQQKKLRPTEGGCGMNGLLMSNDFARINNSSECNLSLPVEDQALVKPKVVDTVKHTNQDDSKWFPGRYAEEHYSCEEGGCDDSHSDKENTEGNMEMTLTQDIQIFSAESSKEDLRQPVLQMQHEGGRKGHELVGQVEETDAKVEEIEEVEEEQHAQEEEATSITQKTEEQILCAANVTGKEGFAAMFVKLKKIGWKWGPKVSMLDNRDTILKPGVHAKASTFGVNRFKTKDEVVEHIQNILRQGSVISSVDNSSVLDNDYKKEEKEDDEENQEETVQHHETEKHMDHGRVLHSEANLSPASQDLQRALDSLRPQIAPGLLHQRSTEAQSVIQFITHSVKESLGGSIYLCGCPGTGKSQTMAHVQAALEAKPKGGFYTHMFHTFQGASLTTPVAMFTAMWQALAGKEHEPLNMEKALSSKLKLTSKATRARPMIVLVVDEIDQLLSQGRQVLSKLFEWAHAPKSRLVLVGIANSIEFDTRIQGRHEIMERKPERVLFRAYGPTELNEILRQRVGTTVDPGAINFCSKKVAASSGDARRAISLCREAVLLAKKELDAKEGREGKSKCKLLGDSVQSGTDQDRALVTIAHMAKVVRAGNMSNYEEVIDGLAPQAQVVLCVAAAMVAEPMEDSQPYSVYSKVTVRAQPLTQGDLHERCKKLWETSRTGGVMSQIEFSSLIDIMAAQGLLEVKCKHGSRTVGRARKLTLQIEFTDVQAALGDQPFFRNATTCTR
ncbi:unnamed protein product [Choristocarpus tenellus]